jgi:hypothetical protein
MGPDLLYLVRWIHSRAYYQTQQQDGDPKDIKQADGMK